MEYKQHSNGDPGNGSRLIIKPPENWSENDSKTVVDIYKVLVDMADKVSQRRQAANSFYLSVNTAIIGASAYISTRSDWTSTDVISVAGIAISVLWARNIVSYRTLNAAKFKVINQIEEALPIAPYTAEWEYLDPDKDGIRHKPFHEVEIIVPWVFALVHLVQAVRATPWRWLASMLT